MSTKDEYAASYKVLITCIAARIPVVLWGPPGQGKTSVIKQIAADQNRHLEVILASIREPQDFAGLPMLSQGVATLMPPDWAKRLAEVKDGILFTDEVNTAPPSVQAALLRVCLDKVAGDCHLGDDTSVIAAANPPEQAADGWDLAPPLANRFCHINWDLPAEVVRDGLAGNWVSYSTKTPQPKKLEEALDCKLIDKDKNAHFLKKKFLSEFLFIFRYPTRTPVKCVPLIFFQRSNHHFTKKHNL